MNPPEMFHKIVKDATLLKVNVPFNFNCRTSGRRTVIDAGTMLFVTETDPEVSICYCSGTPTRSYGATVLYDNRVTTICWHSGGRCPSHYLEKGC